MKIKHLFLSMTFIGMIIVTSCTAEMEVQSQTEKQTKEVSTNELTKETFYYLTVKNIIFLNNEDFSNVLDQFESNGILVNDKETIDKFYNLLKYGIDCQSCKNSGCEYVSTTAELSSLSVVVTFICNNGFYSVSYSPITGNIKVKFLGMP